ncbi:unnamed protein product [Pseudo-nitzschia multistriata]|uniref:Uncharacterized protein n=1 Tax=Pseudo-nitzschia multistriata TaxID=183589 RepID=A0A448ZJV0_9STRA|nr:unnamed protein product [Pseudo-nitzschia multistriata]
MDHSSGDDDDRDLRREHSDRSRRAVAHGSRDGSYGEGRSNGRNPPYQYQHHNYYQSSRDYDTRSQSSQKSDPNSETSAGRGEFIHSNLSTTGSVGSHGSGGGDSRGFPLHGHVHFRNHAISAAHLLNGDPAHQFPPSLYQPLADAPKSDTATVCSGSMLEDIEDVGSHYDGESTTSGQLSASKQPQQQHHHNYPPPTGAIRRSNSKEGTRLVDFAERSQEALRAVFPKQSKSAAYASLSQESSQSHAGASTSAVATASGSNDEDAVQHKKGMGPPLSRHWLLQQHGNSPFRTGSVKSIGSNTGSDVVVNVGSDCGGSLTDAQSVLSQEDTALLSTVNSEISSDVPPAAASAASAGKSDAIDEGVPHPLLCDRSDGKTNGRTSPGGTIYRGRGIRRYKGRFYALPLKRFHQDGVHLHSDSEPESGVDRQQKQHDRWDDRSGSDLRFGGQRGGERHNYHGHAPSRRDRSRSRSRSRSPPAEGRGRETRSRKMDQARGYALEKNRDDDGSS